jgi:hypothetical protein
VRDHGAAHQERALEIDVEHEVPRLFRHFPDEPAIRAVRRGRVVDQHVDAAEALERLLDEPLGIGGSAHVADQREDAASELLDLGGEALEPFPARADLLQPLVVLVAGPIGRDVGRDDVGASPRERDRKRAADSAYPSAPGDQHAPALEFAHGNASSAPTIR